MKLINTDYMVGTELSPNQYEFVLGVIDSGGILNDDSDGPIERGNCIDVAGDICLDDTNYMLVKERLAIDAAL